MDIGYGFATVRWRRPSQQLATRVSVGRFRFGDRGAVAEVTRRFGVVETGFVLRSTSLTSRAGIRLTVPFAPHREWRPARVRLRAPGFASQELGVTVFQSYPLLQRVAGEVLPMAWDLGRTYTGRDWLRPGGPTARIGAMRAAALAAGSRR
jgi:hypothetical protein